MRDKLILILPILALLVLFGGVPVMDPHDWAAYDADSPLTLRGQIKSATVDALDTAIVMAIDDDQEWQVVLAPPSRLALRGLPGERLVVGDTVEVYGFPRRGGTSTAMAQMRAQWIDAGGKRIELR